MGRKEVESGRGKKHVNGKVEGENLKGKCKGKQKGKSKRLPGLTLIPTTTKVY
jgi:hypothetical protein